MSTDNSLQHDSHDSIIKSTSVLSAGTVVSRILGFLRDVLLAKILGTGFRADALFVAFKIPNLLRNFVGEGATNSAVVPVISEYLLKKEKRDFGQFVSVVLVLALIALSTITILGILLAPFIVRIIAPGFIADPEKLDLTIKLTKIIFPYLIFIGLTAYGMAILYTYRSFKAPAFSPCFLNIAIIISAIFAYRAQEPVYILAIGILVGGVLQLFVLVPSLIRTGIRFQMPKTLKHSGALKIYKLLIPRMIGAGVYQLTVLIDTFCASLSAIVGAGGISAIYYANRIIQFPMGVFTIALASAVLPALSGLATNGNLEQLKKTLVFSLKNVFFVMFPSSMLMILLSNPIIRLLFERGEFNQYSTTITSSALLFYSIGLLSFGGIKILVTAFHAMQDTKTPVKVAVVCLAINAALNFILMGPMKIAGIALASSIAATIDFLALFYFIKKRLGRVDFGFNAFIVKALAASLLAGAVVHWSWGHISGIHEVAKLAIVGVLGYIVYGTLCFYLRIEQAQKIHKWILKRK